nr:MAG TPA: hypothetical protein [Caudoviricetes sp.]
MLLSHCFNLVDRYNLDLTIVNSGGETIAPGG